LTEKGYYETSVDEIAARVGIAKGTVYLHFPSKEDLVIAIFERDMQKLVELVETKAASALTTRGKLQAIFQAIYGAYYSSGMGQRMHLPYLVNNSSELRRLFVEKKGCMREQWNQLSVLISSLLEEGKAAGEFDKSMSTPVMLGAFFSLLSPRNYERLLNENQMPSEEIVEDLRRLYFKGIATVKED
jgi:TetR/AcrR family fatty acid metabolism transcriptional regulator